MVERLSRANGPPSPHHADEVLFRQEAGEDIDTREQKPSRPKPEAVASNTLNLPPDSRSRQESPRRNMDSSNEDFPIPAGLSTDDVDPVGTLNLGHLSLQDGGRSR